MSDTPVTQAQWKWVAENLPKVKIDLSASPSYFKGDDRPVESVSWYQCQEFCDRMSVALGYSLDNPREQRVALPSEAEWEYACRAGTTTHYNTGDTLTEDQANFSGNVGETTPVRKYAPNAWDLYDMHGNVWEWCADKWHDSYEGAPTDGSAWVD
jgi:formylglycine-generating enzyme required for sulfatase activity